jgi:hypothetical protein
MSLTPKAFSAKVVCTALSAGTQADDNDWLRGTAASKRGFTGSVDQFLEGKGAVDR